MSIDKIKKLRQATSLGVNECKEALREADGNYDKALAVLKKKGIQIVDKKKERRASQGLIESYVHFGGNFGSLVEINCETDFVARTDVFKKFVKDIAMHVAATAPEYIGLQNIPEDVLSKVADKEEYITSTCLLSQPFIKDNSLTIEEYLKQTISQTGENIVIRRFIRFALGEGTGEES
jgi:elongation factor Ts